MEDYTDAALEEALEKLDCDNKFEIWANKVEPKIRQIMERKEKEFIYESTLFGDNSDANIKSLEISFKQKQKQMKEGEIAQTSIGAWDGWEDLGIGHCSGLDNRKSDNSIIADIKNKHNTCNSGSQKALLDKLANYKRVNPNTRCVWAIVNSKPGCKKLHEIIMHDNVEIEKIQGVELMKLVFTINGIDYSKKAIEFIKATMYQD